MIKIDNIETLGWKHAVRGMRNPLDSHILSDSRWGPTGYEIGKADFNLMKRLSKAGNDHAKYLRMIVVYMDINAPLYWWKQMDQYKTGTVTNSYSTMHTIHKKPLTADDFSGENVKQDYIDGLNYLREKFNTTSGQKYWHALIDTLPSAYMQKRTWMGNYQVLKNIYKSRKNHKLNEWHDFCDAIERLPYSQIITL